MHFPCPYCYQTIQSHLATTACPHCTKSILINEKYQVNGFWGKGGMGAVYQVLRLEDQKPFALKLFSLSNTHDWKAQELFSRGSQVLQHLEHANLPNIYETGETQTGDLFLVRESFWGHTLHERIARQGKRLRPEEFRKLIKSLLELLAYLHEMIPPVYHRDIKPQNIMFRSEEDWEPVLVDFDTVSAPQSNSGITIVSTPGYTAPEQFAGVVSAASDLYSLGVTFLFVATHKEPDTLQKQEGRFQVRHLLEGLEAPLPDLLCKLVEPERSNRYQNARQALLDLSNGISTSPSISRSRQQTHIATHAAPSQSRHRPRAPLLPSQSRIQNVQENFRSDQVIQISPGAEPSLANVIEQAPPWSILQLAPGEYPLHAPLLIEKPIFLRGNQYTNTRIIGDSRSHIICVTSEAFAAFEITIEKKGIHPGNVLVIEAGNTVLEKCQISGGICNDQDENNLISSGNGVVFLGNSTGFVSSCFLKYHARFGILVGDEANPTLEGNDCSHNDSSGISYHDQSSGLAWGNFCAYNKKNGIFTYDSSSPTIEENICYQNKFGMLLKQNSTGVARKNECNENTSDGIYLEGNARFEILENICQRNKDTGIYFNQKSGGLVKKNLCFENEKRGIGVAGESRVTAEENTCSHNGYSGIAYQENSQGKAFNNACQENDVQGMFAGNNATPHFENNQCHRNKQYGIRIRQNAKPVVKNNQCSKNKIDGITVEEKAKPVLENNQCRNNKEAGISYLNEAAGIARENECIYNRKQGIYLQDTAKPTLENNQCRENTSHGIAYLGKSRGIARQNRCLQNVRNGIYILQTARPKLQNNECQNNQEEDIKDLRNWLFRTVFG